MNLVFLGPPGCGKGTQAAKLAQKRGIVHLSTGDMLRSSVRDQTELGVKAKGFMDRGELVPDDLIVSMIEDLLKKGVLSDGFILDGFPRTIPQAEALKDMFAENGLKLDKAVLFDCSDDEILKRLRKRAEIEGRVDDTEEVINNRLEVYRRQTEPIVAFYRKESILTELAGEGLPDEIFNRLESATS